MSSPTLTPPARRAPSPWTCRPKSGTETVTLLHVSSGCGLRMMAVVAQCWQGMARGIDECSQLEEGRSKLLLSPVPPSLGAAAEVPKRLTLWDERRFEDLLRAEEHLLLSRRRGEKTAARQPGRRFHSGRLCSTDSYGCPSQGHRWAHLLHALFRGKRAVVGEGAPSHLFPFCASLQRPAAGPPPAQPKED